MRTITVLAVSVVTALSLTSCRSSSSTTAVVAPTTSAQGEQTGEGAEPSGADWSQFRGPHRTGFALDKGLNKDWSSKPPRLLWKVGMSDGGYAGPAVKGDVVYIVDHQGANDIVKALRLGDGGEIWRYEYADANSSNNGFARATPAIDGDHVYTLSRMGKLLCLGAKTGKLVWSKDLVADLGGSRPQWDYSASPVVDGDKLIVIPGASDGAVVALNKATGATIWKGGSGQGSYATPVLATIGSRKQYVCMLAKSVIGIDASNGRVIWSHPWQTEYDVNASTPLVEGNSVFVTSGYNHGCAVLDLSGASVSVRWQNREMAAHFSTPVLYKGFIYGNSDPGVLVCIDPSDGHAAWKQPGFEKGGVCAFEDRIIAFNGSNGDLVMAVMSPSGYSERGRVNPLGGQSWTAPIISSGRLIVRNTSAIACIDLR